VTAKLKIFLAISVTSLLLDQASKIWVVTSLRLGIDEVKIIPGFLSFVHAQNPFAAMGLGSVISDTTLRMGLFAGFTVVAMGILLNMLKDLPGEDRFQSAIIAMIFSGAIGNAIDRIHKQSVTDFIRVYTDYPPVKNWLLERFGTYEWPTFNIADAAIVVGVVLYLIGYLFEKDSAPAAEGSNPLDNPEEGARPSS
jgi:signal peptidase II